MFSDKTGISLDGYYFLVNKSVTVTVNCIVTNFIYDAKNMDSSHHLFVQADYFPDAGRNIILQADFPLRADAVAT